MFENILHKVLKDHVWKMKTKPIYAMNEMEEFKRACCICTYHVYKDIWEAAIGEELATMLLSLVAFATSLLARAIACGESIGTTGPSDREGHSLVMDLSQWTVYY